MDIYFEENVRFLVIYFFLKHDVVPTLTFKMCKTLKTFLLNTIL